MYANTVRLSSWTSPRRDRREQYPCFEVVWYLFFIWISRHRCIERRYSSLQIFRPREYRAVIHWYFLPIRLFYRFSIQQSLSFLNAVWLVSFRHCHGGLKAEQFPLVSYPSFFNLLTLANFGYFLSSTVLASSFWQYPVQNWVRSLELTIFGQITTQLF